MPCITLGSRFGRLVVTTRAGGFCRCECDCGGSTQVYSSNLRSGRTKSCGCLNREVAAARNRIDKRTHGQTSTPEYRAWQSMRQRCENERDKSFAHYGGRGISVCERWASFESFLADMGERPSPLHSVDRINVNGDYEPDNCRWATIAVQSRNKRTNITVRANGLSGCLVDFVPAGAHSAAYQRVRKAIKRGVDAQKALQQCL